MAEKSGVVLYAKGSYTRDFTVHIVATRRPTSLEMHLLDMEPFGVELPSCTPCTPAPVIDTHMHTMEQPGQSGTPSLIWVFTLRRRGVKFCQERTGPFFDALHKASG